MKIDLESSLDTYLYLLSYNGESWNTIESDDDGGTGSNSQIIKTLLIGNYAIVATPYDGGRTGSFTLTLNSISQPEPEPEPISGCTDSSANNYDPEATESNGSCTYPEPEPEPEPISGCTDSSANNYDSEATESNGSCTYPEPEPEPEPLTYCGDGIVQEPNETGTDGPNNDGYEQCDTHDITYEGWGYHCSSDCTISRCSSGQGRPCHIQAENEISRGLQWCTGVGLWGECEITPPPVLTEVSPIPSPTNDNTPEYTFNSTGEGAIAFDGICISDTTNAVVGDNTIIFNALDDGYYDQCSIRVQDSTMNISEPLYITPFTVSSIAECSASTVCGKSCTQGSLTYGTVLGADGKCWLDRNLGATQVATTYNDSSSYGWLFQWGRGADGHQIRTSQVTSTPRDTDTPGHNSFIHGIGYNADWRDPRNDNLWQGVNGINNPCPASFRLPTQQEWITLLISADITNSVTAFGSVLKLPLGGYRTHMGSYEDEYLYNYYWSSTVDDGSILNEGRSLALLIGLPENMGYYNDTVSTPRAGGASVRCVR